MIGHRSGKTSRNNGYGKAPFPRNFASLTSGSLLAVSLLMASVALPAAARADGVLDIDPIQQSQPGWSWGAVGEMVMRYYRVPNTSPTDDYQCGLANFLAGKEDAQDCAQPGKIGAYQATLKIVSSYEPYAYKFFKETPSKEDPVVMRYEQTKVLPADELIHEIEFERPIIVAIEPPRVNDTEKNTKQVALIVGYKGTADNLQIIVNTPEAYEVGADPYIDAGATALDTGQYQIGYKDFIKEMRWTSTIYRLKPE